MRVKIPKNPLNCVDLTAPSPLTAPDGLREQCRQTLPGDGNEGERC